MMVVLTWAEEQLERWRWCPKPLSKPSMTSALLLQQSPASLSSVLFQELLSKGIKWRFWSPLEIFKQDNNHQCEDQQNDYLCSRFSSSLSFSSHGSLKTLRQPHILHLLSTIVQHYRVEQQESLHIECSLLQGICDVQSHPETSYNIKHNWYLWVASAAMN